MFMQIRFPSFSHLTRNALSPLCFPCGPMFLIYYDIFKPIMPHAFTNTFFVFAFPRDIGVYATQDGEATTGRHA